MWKEEEVDQKNKDKYRVRKFKTSDLASIKRISEELHPEWFTEEALENIPRDIQFAQCYVVEKSGDISGFISVHSYDGQPMIGWLGVDKRMRSEGIGKRLIAKVEEELIKFGYNELRVETVGECSPVYEPYAETLRFYKSLGFEVEKRGRLKTDMGYKWRHSTLKKKLSIEQIDFSNILHKN
jgi:GNAT superfamily N-acetyltransferase